MLRKFINKLELRVSSEAWKFYFATFNRHYTSLIWTTLGSAGQVLLIIPSLLLVRYAFDVLIPQKDIRLLLLAGLAILVLRLLNSAVSLSIRKVHVRIINDAIYNLRHALLNRLYSFSRMFYLGTDNRIIHIRIVEDTERLTNMSTALISRVLPSVLISLGLLLVLVFLNWYLLLIIIAIFPALFFANRFIGKKIKKRVFVFQRSFENFSKGIFFVLRFMSLTLAQSAQDKEIECQRKSLHDLKEKTGAMAMIYAINTQVQEILTGLSAIVIIIVGGMAVATQSMSLGEFLSFYLAAIYLNKYINNFTSALPDIISGNESLTTLYNLFQSQQRDVYLGTRAVELNNAVVLKNVSFSYGSGMVLNKVNLEIKPGDRIAIVGPNGSGKTTLLNLIMGFLPPLEGSISADEVNYTDLNMKLFRTRIGVVFQHPPLFSGTITANICYGTENPDPHKVIAAAKTALAHEFIQKLPDAYNTEIGEDGVLMSGGEGQRIAIARALFRNPKLLILDEPTNHLDHQSVTDIMTSIRTMNFSPAILIISHDQRVIAHAEKVYHLENGTLNTTETKSTQHINTNENQQKN